MNLLVKRDMRKGVINDACEFDCKARAVKRVHEKTVDLYGTDRCNFSPR